MTSKVEICNWALQKLGQPAIMSLDDNSANAKRCAQEYDSALGVVLRSYPWPFALRRAKLVLSTEKPAYEYANYFALPPDVARIISIATEGRPFQIEGKFIATNASAVFMKYVSSAVNESHLDRYTAEAVALLLASKLAIVITENAQLKDMLNTEYQMVLQSAMNTWAVEDMPQEVIEGNWLTSREQGSYADGHAQAYNPWGPNGKGLIGG